jgi:hypothetical protein
MTTQFLLDEDDIKELTKLMLVMIETQESRKQLCRELGINPQEVSFIIGTSDDTFCTELIDCLNRYGYQEYLCKLCCNKLFPILNKSVYSHRISILKKIIEKINCNCNQEKQNHPIPTVPNPDELKSESWFTKISNVNKKLLRNGVIIIMGGLVAAYGLYKYKSFSNSNIFPSDLATASKALQKVNSPGYIVNSLSDSSSNSLCLSTENGDSLNNTPVILWDCNSNSSRTDQRWEFIDGGFIRNTLSGRCIDVPGAPGKDNGARLQLYDCESSGFNRDNGSRTDQRWEIIDGEFIRNTLSGKCIDVDGAPGNGTQLQLSDCKSSGFNRDNGLPTGQRWRLGTSK